MKRIVFTLSCLLIFKLLSAQVSESWYKAYTGLTGTLKTTMHLHKAGKDYSGYVWFEQNQTPIQIYSYYLPKTDSIQISGSNGPISFALTGILNSNTFAGTSQFYKDGNPSKQTEFLLVATIEKSYSSFYYFFTESKDSIPSQYKNHSRFDYFSSSIWPKGTTLLEESLKKFIRLSLDMKTAIVETGKFLTDGKNKLLKEWKANYIKIGPKETAELGMSLSHRQENKILVMHENERLISLAYYYFRDAGGAAHGSFNTIVASYNKQTGKQIQLTDVLNSQGIALLPAILDKVARLTYSIKNNNPLDENGFTVKKILPAKNVYVTDVGIGFIYAPYEIKSFADGEINLVIPFTALGNYLLPGFK